jgi:hypothetical protein
MLHAEVANANELVVRKDFADRIVTMASFVSGLDGERYNKK